MILRRGKKRLAWPLAALLLTASAPWTRADVDEPAPLKVERRLRALDPASVPYVGGFAGERIQVNRTGYLHTFPIDQHTRMVEEKKHRAWWWIGEQPGKWLESAVRASAQAGDKRLREKAKKILARLVAAQEPGGYLGITHPAVRTKALPLRGMDAYELYFTLHGLLTAHDLWQDEAALRAARSLGDYFIRTIGPGKAEFWPRPHGRTIAGHDVHKGWEGTLLTDPMLRIYEATGDTRYVKWSRWAIENLDRWSGHDAFSKLDQVAAGTLGVHQLQPYVHAHTFHMNFLAFLRLYQITGEESLLRKVCGAWRDIASRQMYITGGVSVGEHYEPGHNLPITGHVVETCASMSWLELCQYLLELTGDGVYADAIERLMWNHVFAAQTADGDGNRYHTPLNGVKPAGYFHGPDCCTGSGHRLLAKLPSLIYAHSPEGLYVNQYVDSVGSITLVSGNTVEVTQDTEYPAGENITMTVEPKRPEQFTVRLRIPRWCTAPSLTLNDVLVDARRPGSYVSIRRRWTAGDRLVLTLPMQARWVKGAHTTEGMWALVRGPLVYALDTVWWKEKTRTALDGVPADLAGAVGIAIDPEHPRAKTTRIATPKGALGPAYEATVSLPDGSTFAAPLLPFANIGRWYAEASSKPDPKSAAFAYAVWLHSTSSEAFQRATRAARMLKKTGWRVAKGDWNIDGHVLSQRSLADDCFALCGEKSWTDYTFEVQARKTGGAEGFIIIFRARDTNNFYWWNIAGWQNREHGIEREVDGTRTVVVRRPGRIENGKWYQVKIVVAGSSIKCYLNGVLKHELTDATFSAGRIGLGSWLTQVEYKDMKVTTDAGEILYQPKL